MELDLSKLSPMASLILLHYHLKYFDYNFLCFAAFALANGTWDTITYCAAILY